MAGETSDPSPVCHMFSRWHSGARPRRRLGFFAGDDGKDAVRHVQRLLWELRAQQLGMLAVEGIDGRRIEAGTHAGAGADAAAPSFVACRAR